MGASREGVLVGLDVPDVFVAVEPAAVEVVPGLLGEIAGATTAAIAGNRYALELLPELKALSHRNSHGRIGGAGLTIWPPSLVNLFHWVCGDDCHIRFGTGFPLPESGRLFAESDGLPS